MESLLFNYKDSCGVSTQNLEKIGMRVFPLVQHLHVNRDSLSHTPYAFITIPLDTDLHKQIKQAVAQVKKLSPTILVVIGIGGSNLAIRALQEALLGSLYNQTNPSLKVYYADTVDTDATITVLTLVEDALKQNHTVIINGISKSGSTIETSANLELFVELLQLYKKSEWRKYVVLTTDHNSSLWYFGKQEELTVLEIPTMLGGRYSALSAVGLFPLALLGIDIGELCEGAAAMNRRCLIQNVTNNRALLKAAIIFYHYQAGRNIHDMFLFAVNAESVGKWYRQLMAESLGKEYNRKGVQVHVGITPTVSVGTIDLHSVAQLYLGGPQDKMTTFVTVQKSETTITIPSGNRSAALVPNLEGKTFNKLMYAIVQGVKTAYTQKALPYVSLELPTMSAYYLGQLLQLSMFEIVYLAELFTINAFDQPAVENYKKTAQHWLEKDPSE